MDNRFFKQEVKTDSDGNVSLLGEYDISGELINQITAKKESLWKSFCKQVCEKMVSYYYEDSIDVIHFHRVFNEKFNETIKDWKDE